MKTSSFAAIAALFLAACSSDPASPSDGGVVESDAGTTQDGSVATDAGADVAKAPFAITSQAIKEGETMPSEHTCDGADTHPDLSWTEGPGEGKPNAPLLLLGEAQEKEGPGEDEA